MKAGDIQKMFDRCKSLPEPGEWRMAPEFAEKATAILRGKGYSDEQIEHILRHLWAYLDR